MAIPKSRFLLVLLLMASLGGCTAISPTAASLSSPFFMPTTEDLTRAAILAPELDNHALRCTEVLTCEVVHFARALVSLFENQEAAVASFHRVIGDNPSGALSSLSRLWAALIDNGLREQTSTNGPEYLLLQQLARTMRDSMTQDLAEQMKHKEESRLLPTSNAFTSSPTKEAESPGMVRALQKQVRERDRRIAILQAQMEDLKIIDQDHQSRKRTLRAPGIFR